jgi:hypothetical protein
MSTIVTPGKKMVGGAKKKKGTAIRLAEKTVRAMKKKNHCKGPKGY